ncbi:MAG: RNA polymerase sigma factor [Gracilibacteraceae bacterium]|jgi:RNA polymerase sigma-70 factor (ECF subfamily)|nr:RNA polymerase sigma factor [Gracilibacteraceae bacterium]
MDREDVLRAMRGDGQSFYRIVEEKKQSVYRMAYSYARNEEDALDIVQDAVYKAYVSIGKLKNPEFFGTWFYRIALNCARDFVKKNRKVIAVADEVLVNIPDHDMYEAREESADLTRALETLGEKYKTVVLLRFFEELSLDEIAAVLKIPVSTVKTRLYRALEKLKINAEEVNGVERAQAGTMEKRISGYRHTGK